MFVPVVCDYYCGMQVLVPLDLTLAGTTAEQVAAGIAGYYKDAATLKVHALNEALPENGLYSNAMAGTDRMGPVSYTPPRAQETDPYLVCRLLLAKKTLQQYNRQLHYT